MRSGAPRPRILWYPITSAMLLLLCCSRLRSVVDVGLRGGERVLFSWEVLSEVHLGECRRTLEKSGIRGPTIIA